MKASDVIKIERTVHRDKEVILLRYHGRYDWLRMVKSLPCSRYSATYRCFYIPYDIAAYNAFVELGIPHDIPEPKVTKSPPPIGHAQDVLSQKHISDIEPDKARHSDLVENSTLSTADISHATVRDLTVTYSNKYFQIKTPYNEAVIRKIKSLRKAWWSETNKTWTCYGSHENYEKIQNMFQCWSDAEQERIEKMIVVYDTPTHVVMYQVPHTKDVIYIEIRGYRKIDGPIRRIPHREYDKNADRWTVPYHMDTIAQLKRAYKDIGIEITDRILYPGQVRPREEHTEMKQLTRVIARLDPETAAVADAMRKRMYVTRYSPKTIQQYTGAMIKYAEWLHGKSVNESTQKDVMQYLMYINSQKVSDSLVNRYVSALKLYFSKVIETDIEITKIERPRVAHRLPKILSQDEVMRMIEVTDNIKHRNILYSIYSSGIRLNELFNLEIKDINWDRNQIFVRGAKGKKDRVVMLSDHLKQVLVAYFHKYKPVRYLYEGLKPGKKYAMSSIQKMVGRAGKKANISQSVTPHVLRHCFATHLHDKGISIAIIQHLLGHKNLKTTLIYTHISTQQVTDIRSPLDDMMSKNNTLDG